MDANQAKLAFSAEALCSVLGPWNTGDGPLSTRLAAALQQAIERGELLPEMRLPPERELARALATGRGTIAAAYEHLLRARLVARRQGSGTWIRPATIGNAAEEFASRSPHRLASLVADDDATLSFQSAAFGAPAGIEALYDEARAELARAARDRGYLPQGYAPLRKAIAARLQERGLPTDPSQILVTTGAQQGIALTALALTRPKDFVLLEDPTFAGAMDAYRYVGARLLPVPMSSNGMNLDLATETLARVAVRLIYTMPGFHNPTGVQLPLDARRQLIELGERHDTLIIEDDTFGELALGDSSLPPLAASDRHSRVILVGSLSKIFWGGLRVGWVRAPRAVLGQLAHAKGVLDLASAVPSQVLATVVLRHGARLRRARIDEARVGLELLTTLLRGRLPSWTYTPPAGGLVLWTRIPHGSATELARVARRHGVAILPGTALSPSGGADDRVRLPVTLARREMTDAVSRLARAWDEYASAPRSRVVV